MGIKDIRVQTLEVEYGNDSFRVRGLSADDLKVVLSLNRESVEMLSDLAEAKGIVGIEAITAERIFAVAETAMMEIPDLVAMAIAQCEVDGDSMGDVRNFAIVKRLPISVQMDAVMKIAKCTFEDDTNFGAFLGKVMAAVKSVKATLPTPPIRDGVSNTGTVN